MKTYRVKQQRKVSIWVEEEMIVEAHSEQEAKDKARNLDAIDYLDTEFLLETEIYNGDCETLNVEEEK